MTRIIRSGNSQSVKNLIFFVSMMAQMLILPRKQSWYSSLKLSTSNGGTLSESDNRVLSSAQW